MQICAYYHRCQQIQQWTQYSCPNKCYKHKKSTHCAVQSKHTMGVKTAKLKCFRRVLQLMGETDKQSALQMTTGSTPAHANTHTQGSAPKKLRFPFPQNSHTPAHASRYTPLLSHKMQIHQSPPVSTPTTAQQPRNPEISGPRPKEQGARPFQQ